MLSGNRQPGTGADVTMDTPAPEIFERKSDSVFLWNADTR